jgi:hypothetical protein
MKTVSLHYVCDECAAEIDVAVPPGLINVDFTAPRILAKAEHGDFCSVACSVSWFQAKTDAFVE